MSNIYTTGAYLESTETWHSEDSEWKAGYITQILTRNNVAPGTVVDVGCGAGRILSALSQGAEFQQAKFLGYDISPQAIELARPLQRSNLQFRCGNAVSGDLDAHFDLLLAIDVFEHVRDYMAFLERCRELATYQVYHIPIEIHVSAVVREAVTKGRYTVGHLHYFTPASALAVLRDTGHEILDSLFTDQAVGLFRTHPTLTKAVANVPRWLISRVSPAMASRLLGGYSLLVLTRSATGATS